MPGLCLALLQLASSSQGAPPPDIEINARVTAREVVVRQSGEASLSLRASPGEAMPVEVERSAPKGATRYRNLTLKVHGAARISEPRTHETGTNTDDNSP